MQRVGVWSANRGINTYTVLPVQKEISLCLLLGVKSNRVTYNQITKLGAIFTAECKITKFLNN